MKSRGSSNDFVNPYSPSPGKLTRINFSRQFTQRMVVLNSVLFGVLVGLVLFTNSALRLDRVLNNSNGARSTMYRSKVVQIQGAKTAIAVYFLVPNMLLLFVSGKSKRVEENNDSIPSVRKLDHENFD